MFNVGDKVTVRSVSEMLNDGCEQRFPSRPESSYYLKGKESSLLFKKGMEQYCNHDYYIATLSITGGYFLKDIDGGIVPWIWADYMLKPAEEKSFDIASEADIDCLYD